MGKVFSTVGRKATTRFNIEHRAQKAIEKQANITKAAPKHETTVDHFKSIEQKYPNIREELEKKDDGLLDKLKQVRIESYGPPPEIKPASQRTLPQDRSTVTDTVLGFHEPEIVPPGQITMKSVLDILGKHMVEPKTYTASVIAAKYNMDAEKVKNMLEHFQTFSLYVPNSGDAIAGKLRQDGLLGEDKTLLDTGDKTTKT